MSSAYANASNANREMCSSDTWSRVATRQICYYQSSREYLNRASRVLYFVPGLRSRTWTVEIFSRAGTRRVPETSTGGSPVESLMVMTDLVRHCFLSLYSSYLRDIILRRPKEPHGLEQGAIVSARRQRVLSSIRWYLDKYGDVARQGVRWVV